MDVAIVNGRHLIFSHSLVIARCTPTSTPGFSFNSFTASGNHGDGTITSIDLSIPCLKDLINASLPECVYPISSPLTNRRILFGCALTIKDIDKKTVANNNLFMKPNKQGLNTYHLVHGH